MHFVWPICIYKTKLLTFPNIPVISLHQPVLSSNLMLGNRNLPTCRENQTPSYWRPPPPFYSVLINYKNHYSINIHNSDAVQLKIIQFVHSCHFIWHLLLVTSHCCSTIHVGNSWVGYSNIIKKPTRSGNWPSDSLIILYYSCFGLFVLPLSPPPHSPTHNLAVSCIFGFTVKCQYNDIVLVMKLFCYTETH
jgi:hypothetical protein